MTTEAQARRTSKRIAKRATLRLNPAFRTRERVRDRATKYGLTVDKLISLYAPRACVCGEVHAPHCPICGTDQDLVIDHDHVTLELRGLPCRKCNAALGLFRDDPEILRNAIEYLEKAVAA